MCALLRLELGNAMKMDGSKWDLDVGYLLWIELWANSRRFA